jgi:hypothetical protein
LGFAEENDLELVRNSLYTQGLSFPLLSPADRTRVASAIQRAAVDLIAKTRDFSGEYEESYVERLQVLVRLLAAEMDTSK